MTIVVDNWIAGALVVAFMLPMLLASAACGFGAWYIFERQLRRFRGGRVLRQAAYRSWPNKFTGEKSPI